MRHGANHHGHIRFRLGRRAEVDGPLHADEVARPECEGQPITDDLAGGPVRCLLRRKDHEPPLEEFDAMSPEEAELPQAVILALAPPPRSYPGPLAHRGHARYLLRP